MASLEDGLQKHQKVYSFLKRTLSQDRYEGIRVIEPCVIVAEGLNKAFTFAILGDEMLYITENPPRAPKDIRITVDLSTIASVKLIHDIAEFLGGDLKTKVQHILITYKMPKVKTQSASTGDFTSKTALQSPLLMASTLLQINPDEYGHNGSNSGKFRSRTLPVQSSYAQLRTSNSLTIQTRNLKLSASEGNIHNLVEVERLQSASSSSLKRNMLLPICSRPLPQPPSGNSFDLADTQNRRRRKKTRRKQDKETDQLDSSSSSNDLDFSSFTSTSHSDLQPLDSRELFRSASPDMHSSTIARQYYRESSNESNGSGMDLQFDIAEESDSKETETVEMHIYILEGRSPMFAFLKSTWNSCILRSTLQYSSGGTPISSSRSLTKVDNSQLLTLFNQLKTEILQSHRMEKSFVLINELLTAAYNSFSLKKFFWKSPDLFQFLVEQIQTYLPYSPSSQSRRRGNNRADELDYAVVLLQTLVCMFRETEILLSRMNVLNAHKGQSLKDLLEHMIATPTVGRKAVESKISPAAQLLLSGSTGELLRTKKEEETNKLLDEITDCVTSVIYEIITAVHQAGNFTVESNVLNIFWLMKIFDSHDASETYAKRMMERQMSITLSDHKHLSPQDTVLLYRQLYILHNVLEYSNLMAVSIPRNYAEEFRYYIKRNIEKKLPVKYPLTSPILSLLELVSSAILTSKSSVR